jgi:hypothetical protein
VFPGGYWSSISLSERLMVVPKVVDYPSRTRIIHEEIKGVIFKETVVDLSKWRE